MKCPTCKKSNVIKKGKRKTQYQIKQRYLCKDCGKKFTENGKINNKKYPIKVIYSAINFYNLGYNYKEVSNKINKKYKIKTSKSTIHNWIHEFKHLSPMIKKRDKIINYDQVIFSKYFDSDILEYEFMYHKYKADTILKQNYPQLLKYLGYFEKKDPELIDIIDSISDKPKFRIEVKPLKYSSFATEMADFASQAKYADKTLHNLVERFMLVNDEHTIACELPVWYYDKKRNIGITGQIDILQIKNDLVYILDYEPDLDNMISSPWELYHYAIALSFRANINPKKIRCAWFNENDYYEYSPHEYSIYSEK